MKSLNDNNNNNGSTDANNNTNWLGFSLSPDMKKMEVASSQHQTHHSHQFNHQNQPPLTPATTAVPTSFCLSSSHYLNSFGVSDSIGFHPPISVMPLKSDGSLCMMEALRRSQTEGSQ